MFSGRVKLAGIKPEDVLLFQAFPMIADFVALFIFYSIFYKYLLTLCNTYLI